MSRVGRVLVLLLANLAVAALCEGVYRAVTYLTMRRPDPTIPRIEVYGVGESTLIGEPFDPKISIFRLLHHMFDGRLGGQPIDVMNLAERGVPLYPQALAFERRMAARRGNALGVVLIVSGHNEGIDPADRGTAEPFVSSRMAEHSLIVRDLLLALRRRRVIVREKTLAAYEHYLRRVIETALRNGLLPIVSTMVSNISRIEPNIDGTSAQARTLVEPGLALEDQGRLAEARDIYLASLGRIDHSRALLYYRAGRCEEQLGNFAAAREYYWAAVDSDPRSFFGRATREQNELVRRLAREYDIPLVDAVAIFERSSLHGFPAPELFADGQHPSIAGYLLLADAFADVLSQRFHTRIVRRLRDVNAVGGALGLEPADVHAASVAAGSWLVAASIDHPCPRDRMILATAHFHNALGKGDDFSAWLGLGLAQAAMRGGLRSGDDLASTCRHTRSYHVPPGDLAVVIARLAALGVDRNIVHQIRVLGQGAS